MRESGVNLAALIGSRICHDLISPIGAIANGLELLDLAGAVRGPEMALIADSAGNAGARIQFFRIAYGAAGDQMLGRAEIAAILGDVTRAGRIAVCWEAPGAQPRAEVRIAFLAVQCLETAMPFGGSIRIDAAEGTWSVAGQAAKFNLDPDLWAGLAAAAAPPEITPALVQFALLPPLLAEAGRGLAITRGPGEVVLRF